MQNTNQTEIQRLRVKLSLTETELDRLRDFYVTHAYGDDLTPDMIPVIHPDERPAKERELRTALRLNSRKYRRCQVKWLNDGISVMVTDIDGELPQTRWYPVFYRKLREQRDHKD